MMPKYVIIEQRTEFAEYEVSAANEAEARERYLQWGQVVDVWQTEAEIRTISRRT